MKKIYCIFVAAALLAPAKKFYSDDPLNSEPKNLNVATAENRKLSDYYDLFSNVLTKVGETHPNGGPPIRAKAVNTLGEPMDGAWWEKRHYYQRLSPAQLKRGVGNENFPSPDGKWTIVSAKSEGVTPGFTVRDSRNKLYFIKFDPMTNPEMATAADAITTRIFYALGYHVPENDIINFSPSQLAIGDAVTVLDQNGKPRKMTQGDVDDIFSKLYKGADGKYRATASLALPGKPIGPAKFYGTRSDDPNDVVPHEHRRELRGFHVFAAWVDHDDSRAINNLDILFKDGDTQYVKHYLLDFGSTLGSGTQTANSPRSGNYYFTFKDSARELFTLGLMPPYWTRANYPDLPSIGRFEWKVFDPEKWTPEYPNPAFRNRLPDDEFWAAKQVAAFTDEDLKILISNGQYSDPKASAWLLECLSKRRDKIGKVYFSKVLPFDQFDVRDGELKWVDLGAKHQYLPAQSVTLQWFSFDNEGEKKSPLAGQTTAKLPTGPMEGYYGLSITSTKNPKQTIDVFLRGNRVVGIDRNW